MSGPSDTYDPSTAITEMQKLDDIEADLADTALAVAAEVAVAPEGTTAGETEQARESSSDGLVQNAEAIEQVLEQAIPEAPSHDHSATPHDSAETAPAASSTPIPAPSQTPAPVSSSATPAPAVIEAQEAVQAVADDVNVPILPETAFQPAQADGETDMEVEVPAESSEGLTAGQPSVDEVLSPSSKPLQIPSGAGLPPRPDVLEPGTSIAHALPQQQPQTLETIGGNAQPNGDLKPIVDIDVDLPEGLSSGSSSILANPDLYRAWARDPKNPNIILAFFNWSSQKSEVTDARAWYNVLAKDEPTAVQPLLTLINLELALSNFSEVEQLFAKALRGPSGGVTAAADVSIWKAYLHYIRRQNTITEANAETTRGTIAKAYEYALTECGTDRESGEIWQEYIAFIGEVKPKDTWDTQAQVDTLRGIYQQAVRIPLNNVEALWKAYDAFESSNNKATAKKFLAEKSPAYMTARTALRELRGLTDSLPRPTLPPRPTFTDTDRQMVNAWKAYLKWEEGNPLVIEDSSLLAKRIDYALKKCLGEMRHFPELWHYASHHYISSGQVDQAAEVLTAGAEACPSSLLLTFALAEIEEDRKNLSRCHEIYESLLGRLNPEIEDMKKQVAIEVENARGPEIPQKQGDDVDMTGDGMSEVQKLVEEREARGKLVAERRGKDVADLAAAAGVVWVMYMRFARRAEGIKAARGVFGKARKAPNPTWHVFEASAMMEYHVNKDSAVAIRIFELGLKLFSEEVDYVVKYLQFLISINDDTNARALFERSTAKIPAEKARSLWDTWARYEYMFGDLSGVHKLEARFAEVFPADSALKRFAQRFTYNGLDQIALRDLGFGLRHPPPVPAPAPISVPQPISTFAPQAMQPHNPPPMLTNNAIPMPPPTLQPHAGTSLPPPPRPISPPIKRALPESPRQRPPSPAYKRARPGSPPNRFTPPPRDRIPSGAGGPPMPPRGFRNGGSRDRSTPPPGVVGYRRDGPGGGAGPGYGPPGGYGPPPVPAPGTGYAPPGGYGGGQYDRSGLARPLAHFVGNLPSARSFDGPVFRPDDIIGLFGNIARDGSSTPYNQAPAPAGSYGGGAGGGYGPPGGAAAGGYGAPPPPPQGRAGYGDPRGYGGAPPRRY